MSAVDEELVFKAATLARRAPVEWEAFIVAMKAHASEQKDTCIRAPVTALVTFQGRAQEAASLSDLFEGAIKAADRIETKRRGS